MSQAAATPLVGVVMGSKSDWSVMEAAVRVLREFDIPYEARVVSAHRTPDLLFEYAEMAQGRGLRAIIAGAGGAAHLPGMLAAKTIVPVLGVPVPATALNGMDALLSIVQMPRGVPVATFAIGEAGAVNAALFAIAVLAANDEPLGQRLADWREGRRLAVLDETLDDAPHTAQEPPKFNEDTQIALSEEPARGGGGKSAQAPAPTDQIQDPL